MSGRAAGHSAPLLHSQGVLTRVADVKETILILVLLVDGTHQGRRRGQHLVDEDEDGLLRCELRRVVVTATFSVAASRPLQRPHLYALSDHIDKLTNRQV